MHTDTLVRIAATKHRLRSENAISLTQVVQSLYFRNVMVYDI